VTTRSPLGSEFGIVSNQIIPRGALVRHVRSGRTGTLTPRKEGVSAILGVPTVRAPRTFRHPTYLRVVVTTTCNHKCKYCHMEGDPGQNGQPTGLSLRDLTSAMSVLSTLGLRKVKLLGGEPLARRDIAKVVAMMRSALPSADLSVITAGGVKVAQQDQVFNAGLDRMNVSIHGFGEDAFRARGNNPRLREQRTRFVDALVARGTPLKLNYVYSGPHHGDDLRELLRWAAPRGVLVNVLDDLGSDESPHSIRQVLEAWYGAPSEIDRDDDRDSLDTLRLRWPSGLHVEIKDRHLGELSPWAECATCSKRSSCREGVFALRLTHDGRVAPCMDRGDLAFDLLGHIEGGGVEEAKAALARWLNDLVYGADGHEESAR